MNQTGTTGNKKPPDYYEPTPEEIAALKVEIRSGWAEKRTREIEVQRQRALAKKKRKEKKT